MSETIEETLIDHMNRIGKLTKQRDALLAACEAWNKFLDSAPGDFEIPVATAVLMCKAVKLTEAAIALAKN